MNIASLTRLLARLIDYFKSPMPTPRGTLYLTALTCLGTDASPSDEAPDELGCAESVNAIHKKAFGYTIGGSLSTRRMYLALVSHPQFKEVAEPREGDIIISPTGYGNGRIPNGHVGIVGKNGIIMSSSSADGLFEENYTLRSWRERYEVRGGYPVKFFSRI